MIELSTLGARMTTAGPLVPNEPPMIDSDPSVRVGPKAAVVPCHSIIIQALVSLRSPTVPRFGAARSA